MIREPEVSEAPQEMVDELRDYVNTIHIQKRKGAQAITDRQSDKELAMFKDWCSGVFDDLGIPHNRWDFWCSILTRQDGNGEGCQGFPHNHMWNGVTLVLYLQVPEDGGDLVVLEEDVEEARISPRTGLAVTVGGYDDHGVERIVGETPRVTIITTVFPNEDRK